MAGDGTLNLGHVLAASGVTDVSDVVVLRHTPSDELQTFGGVTPAGVLAYTRAQRGNKLPARPAGTWLIFLADGRRRSRFFGAYDNQGEVGEERTADLRFFDLRPSSLMSALTNRLVVEWPKDTINWAKPGPSAATFPVVEIADPEVVDFPGFDRVLIS